MADRFLASYEDDFSSRPNSGRARSSVMPNSLVSPSARYQGAPDLQRSGPDMQRSGSDWPEADWQDPHYQTDLYDRHGGDAYSREEDYAPPSQPIFAPLDRRAAQNVRVSAQSHSNQSFDNPPNQNRQPRENRASYDQMQYAPHDAPAYGPPAYGMPSDRPPAYGPPADRMPAYASPVYEPPLDGHFPASNYPAFGPSERGFSLQSYRVAKMTQWAGTICSVLVVLGAVYWAYELAVRDAHGIPVVRAAEGPLRIAPTTPGGEISANQGLAVNSIAAKGGSETLPDVVTLAPAPAQLAQEDVAETTSAEAPAAVAQTAVPEQTLVASFDVPEPTGSDLADLAAKTPDVMPISDEAAVEAALAMALSDGNEPATKSNTDTSQPVELADGGTDAAIAAPPTSEVDPASIPAGTKLVQLGAFDDDAAARASWAVLQTQFTDLIGTKSLVVQQAKSGGRIFYRLRAHGFADEDETRRFCAALLAENASCIPVSQR